MRESIEEETQLPESEEQRYEEERSGLLSRGLRSLRRLFQRLFPDPESRIAQLVLDREIEQQKGERLQRVLVAKRALLDARAANSKLRRDIARISRKSTSASIGLRSSIKPRK